MTERVRRRPSRGANIRKLNPESLSPEANLAKKHQGGSSPENRDERFASLSGERLSDVLSQYKWSGGTIYDSIDGPGGPFMSS